MNKKDTSQYVGMEIGFNIIRVADISVKQNGYVLEHFIERKMDVTIMVNGAITDYGALLHAIEGAINEKDYPRNKKVAMALKGPSVITKCIPVYNENFQHLSEEFRWIVDQYAGIDQEEYNIDYRAIGPSKRHGFTDVLMIASKRDTLKDFISVMLSTNAELGALEPEATALQRIYNMLGYGDDNCLDAIIHIGYVGTLILFMRDGVVAFCMPLLYGSKNFIEAISSELNIGFEEAELMRIDPHVSPLAEKVCDILKRRITYEYVAQVDRIFTFYQLSGGYEPSRILFSGIASTTHGLEEAFEEKYAVPVTVLDPWTKITPMKGMTIPEHKKCAYNVVLGLALYNLEK